MVWSEGVLALGEIVPAFMGEKGFILLDTR